MSVAVAAAVSLGVASGAWWAGALTRAGAAAAVLVGTAILWGTGWAGGAVLGAFFVSASLLGRLAQGRPSASDARGERRDPVQVLANGGPAGAFALLGLRHPELGLWIVTASLAAATADTWATALGATSPEDPRDLLSRRRVPRGTSGGVSTRGSLGGAAGALLVAAVGAAVTRQPALLIAGTLIGVGGMFLDSLLGASVQARFRCPACGVASERRRHGCGTSTTLTGGWWWLDNDGVNGMTTLVAALAGAVAWAAR
jgi:uncharacterized protein (TIGR00297 family)